MKAICAFCGHDFDPSGGDHGCDESKPNPSLVNRLTEDHRDTDECEHRFNLHDESTCPNVVCLGRDLHEAAAELTEAREILAELIPSKLCGESWGLPEGETVSIVVTFGKLKRARAFLAGYDG